MKDTSVPWLGQVPKHWQPMRFAYLVEFRKGLSITKADLRDSGIPCVSYGEVHSKYGFEVNPERHALKCVEERFLSESPRSLLANGDFVFADTSEDVAGSGNFTYLNSESRIFAGYHTIIARPTVPIHHRYLAYQLDTKAYRAQIQSQVSGVKVFSITKEILRNLVLYLPPLDEQRAIAAFLDHKTAQIDSLIDKKRRMIELLKEKRTALISRAVTKGLNPDVPMKDSGVPWLGQVPAHWEVRALKGLVRRLTDGAHISPDVSSPDFAFVSTVDLKPNGIDFDGCLRTTKESYEYLVRNGCQPNAGDVLFSKDGTVGRTAVIDRNRDFVVASSLVIISPLPQINSWFLERYLNSAGIKQEVELLMSGTALRRISVLKVGRLSTVVPPTVEQKAIVEFLNLEIGKIDTIASKTEQAIQKLLEYRIAVISAAVTGQIDVRNHGAA